MYYSILKMLVFQEKNKCFTIRNNFKKVAVNFTIWAHVHKIIFAMLIKRFKKTFSIGRDFHNKSLLISLRNLQRKVISDFLLFLSDGNKCLPI